MICFLPLSIVRALGRRFNGPVESKSTVRAR